MSIRSTEVVITGAGLVTPLGLTRERSWQAILEMRCGMGPMTAMESSLPPSADGGQAPDLPVDFSPDLPREARYLRFALAEALCHAGVEGKYPYPADRCGIILGTTLHGMRSAGRFLRSGDFGLLKDFLAENVLRHAASELNFEGGSLTTCSACSSSLGAIAMGVTLLRSGDLDLVVAGGYDTISEYVYAGFNSLRLVADGPLRPFARDRRGMKLAEGYGIVVLERSEDARRRGVKPLAAVLGFGESSDAHHLTQPHPQGDGAARSIRQALRDAELTPREIDLIAAHATGTPDNDAAEFAAFSKVFGEQLPRVPVVCFKSHLGHTLGGAGAVELILSALALRDQIVPACVNVCAEDVEFPGLNLAACKPRKTTIRATLNTSLGFGGANTCMVLGPPPAGAPVRAVVRREDRRDVFITGIGVAFPGIIGNEALAQRFCQSTEIANDAGNVSEADILPLLNARRVRRMSEYVKISLAATALCLRDASIDDIATFTDSCAAVLGTTHGSATYSEMYYRQIVEEGIAAANPMLFAEGVPNSAAAHLSLMLSLKGPCQTIIGSRTAGLDALRIAAARIAGGEWDRAIVSAAEGYATVVNNAYRHWPLRGSGGFYASAGAVTLMLESRSSLQSRGARPRAEFRSGVGAMINVSKIPRCVRRAIEQIGRPSLLITSANNTWLDRAETTALPKNYHPILLRPYPHIGECFSALPLAGLAAALLMGGGPSIGAIATDYAGAVSAVSVERLDL